MSDFDAMLAELESIEGDPRTKSRVRRVLARYAGQRVWISHQALVAFERRHLLARLAREHYDRSDLVRIIAERWGVTRSTARRWVAQFHA
jgi:hypothetical protein